MPMPATEFDSIVVGTGPGGATVARELARQGKKVLILEWGDYAPTRGSALQVIPQTCIPGKSFFLTRQMLATVRAITTGGSSMIYCATAFEPPIDMLKSYGVDISAEASAMPEDVPIDVLNDNLMGAGPRRFLESARELGYDAGKAKKFIYPEKCREQCPLCSYGCPFGAKWNARHFVAEAIENGAVMINKARVEHVIIENGKSIGVQYCRKGRKYQAFAHKTIIAAGGIGSPQILRKSGIKDSGRNFFFDPLVYVFGTIKGLDSGKAVPMSAGVHFSDDGIVMTDFNMPHLMKTALNLEALKLRQVFSYTNVLPIMIKIRDDLGGEISKRGWVNKQLGKNDRLRLDKGVLHARRILANAGATEISQSWIFAAHPGGTVKIGDQLDADLKTQFDNLYVCDCSVIPQEMGLPPTWTILSLAKRLAGHLLAMDSAATGPAIEKNAASGGA